ncbi:hypothetical protein [Rhizobium leguminosarum]|uniref:hypothetical protein n=1 Tax=Rhizobium leguminosarum TaxID=384 RepID=UPI001C937B55|nr:hypothetical protein [Rhizobium leguminosarum]MBY5698386.1 hypothetical protein [Rhizobium leguminosarum]
MGIQVPAPKKDQGKLIAAGVVGAVLLVAIAMPRVVRNLFIVVIVLAAASGFWLAYH